MKSWYRQKIKPQGRKLLYGAIGAASGQLQGPHAFVHLIAMARSGSSLLTNLLTASPDICGYGENKIEIKSRQDLNQIRGKVLFMHMRHRLPRAGNEKYILDKIVHDGYLDIDHIDVLRADEARIIFLLREPIGNIASLTRVLNWSEERATSYYTTRTKTMTRYAQALTPQKACVFLTYRQLIEDTPGALRLLENYLDLSQPLTEEYSISRLTGKLSYGDNSQNIQAGRVLKTQQPDGDAPPPSDNIRAAQTAFENGRRALNACCLHL